MNCDRQTPLRLVQFQDRCKASRPQRGLALIMVLWLIVLLGVIAGGHVKNVHTETLLASRQVKSAIAYALADAGVQHAILQLLIRDPAQQWPVNGTIMKIDFNGSEIFVAVRDASGLIDLNNANTGLLNALLAAANVDVSLQQEIVGAILDWRDADNLTHLHGAEDADYRATGRPWSARDGAFSCVEELRYVLGMTQQLFDDLAPFLTVYSGQSGIDLEFAPPFLITALTGQDIEAVARYGISEPQPRRISSGSGTYHIYVGVPGDDGVIASVEAVIRIASGDVRAYRVLSWREPMRSPFAPAESTRT